MSAIRDIRVMVMADANRPMIQPARSEQLHQSEIKMEKLQLGGTEHDNVSVSIGVLQNTQPPVALRIY